MENYELNFTRLIQMAEQRDYISLKKELETLRNQINQPLLSYLI